MYRSGTIDATALVLERCFVLTHQLAALYGRHLECVTSNRKSNSVNRCIFTWGTILPNFPGSNLKWQKLRLFWRWSPKNKKNKI